MKKLIDHFEEYLLISSMFFSVTLVFIQIVMRYVFKSSIFWSEELTRYLFLWQIWLGASYAAKEGKHLRIEFVKEFLGRKGRAVFECIALSIWFCFCIFLAYKSSELTIMLFQSGQLSPAMRIPMGYAYASVPVGSGIMAARLVQHIRLTLKSGLTEGAA